MHYCSIDTHRLPSTRGKFSTLSGVTTIGTMSADSSHRSPEPMGSDVECPVAVAAQASAAEEEALSFRGRMSSSPARALGKKMLFFPFWEKTHAP